MVVVVTSAGAADIGLPIPSLLRVVAVLMVPISVLILPVVVKPQEVPFPPSLIGNFEKLNSSKSTAKLFLSTVFAGVTLPLSYRIFVFSTNLLFLRFSAIILSQFGIFPHMFVTSSKLLFNLHSSSYFMMSEK